MAVPAIRGGAAPPVRRVTRVAPPPGRTARPVASSNNSLPFTDPQPAEGPSAVAADAAALGVEAGVAAFVRPPPMEVGKFTMVKFVAGPKEADIRTQTEGAVLTASTAVYVGKAMRVSLLDSPSFEIKPRTKAEQITGLDKTATWSWDVKPLNGDAKALEAQIEIFALNPDGSFGQALENYTRQVEVEVRVGRMQSFSDAVDDGTTIADKLSKLFGSWQKAIGALVALLGAIGVLMWRLGLRKAKPAE